MTLADMEDARADPALSPSATAADVAVDLSVPKGCPFLLSQAGGWRLDLPSRDHRCAAFTPASPLSPEKQARLCLSPTHSGCATYLASMAAREARLGVVPGDRATRWGLARTTTVIEDAGGIRGRLTSTLLDRRRWPAIPAVLLVATLFALALSGFRVDIPATASSTSSPGPTPAGTPSSTQGQGAIATDPPDPTAPPSAAPTTAPTAAPTEPPIATPKPTKKPAPAFRTYTVQRFDTLSGIAARYGTTTQALMDLNNITNPNQLSIGQVLRIP
jgi:LysM repeat protein